MPRKNEEKDSLASSGSSSADTLWAHHDIAQSTIVNLLGSRLVSTVVDGKTYWVAVASKYAAKNDTADRAKHIVKAQHKPSIAHIGIAPKPTPYIYHPRSGKKAEPSIYPELLKNSNKVYKLIAENMSKKGLLGDIGEIGFKTSKVINGLFDVKEGTLGILDKATNAPKAFQGGVETVETLRAKPFQSLEKLMRGIRGTNGIADLTESVESVAKAKNLVNFLGTSTDIVGGVESVVELLSGPIGIAVILLSLAKAASDYVEEKKEQEERAKMAREQADRERVDMLRNFVMPWNVAEQYINSLDSVNIADISPFENLLPADKGMPAIGAMIINNPVDKTDHLLPPVFSKPAKKQDSFVYPAFNPYDGPHIHMPVNEHTIEKPSEMEAIAITERWERIRILDGIIKSVPDRNDKMKLAHPYQKPDIGLAVLAGQEWDQLFKVGKKKKEKIDEEALKIIGELKGSGISADRQVVAIENVFYIAKEMKKMLINLAAQEQQPDLVSQQFIQIMKHPDIDKHLQTKIEETLINVLK